MKKFPKREYDPLNMGLLGWIDINFVSKSTTNQNLRWFLVFQSHDTTQVISDQNGDKYDIMHEMVKVKLSNSFIHLLRSDLALMEAILSSERKKQSQNFF